MFRIQLTDDRLSDPTTPLLDERSRRRWAAAESMAIGYGGDALASSATALGRETIRRGAARLRAAKRRRTASDPRVLAAPGSSRSNRALWARSKR